MKVQKLIDFLSEYSPEAEVRLYTQPRYPLESALGGDLGDEPEVVFLLEGRQLGYGRSLAWEVEAAGR